ncbi:MAG: TonB-dependent receptor [Muribaculaceae bacterium]|nr:TonB-dependent receptor [Muribaculaceae bacterium]
MKKILSALMLLVAVCFTAAAQTEIVGTVTDESHEPLLGASVVVKGQSRGVATDIDGKFSLSAKPGDVLRVTYVGYEPAEAKVPASGKMEIILKEASGLLDEVVVVGVSMKKSDLTGAVSHIDSDVLTQKPVTSINEALQGRVTGVSVTRSAKPSDDSGIKIRGTNTINSGSDPIYVVDGLVMGNEFGFYNSLNVNDIESIQVLKDASATALYGSRGANGVIIVTTKKGKQGNGQVSYDGWVSWQTMGHRPERMNATQLGDLRKQSYINGYLFENPNASAQDLQDHIDNYIMAPGNVFAAEELDTYLSGRSYDWVEPLLRTGITTNHNLSFSQATDKTNVYISLGLKDLRGMVKGTDQQRYNGRINASANITPWLKVGTNTTYSYSHDNMTDDNAYNKAYYCDPLVDNSPFMSDETRHETDYLCTWWQSPNTEKNNNFNPYNTLEIKTERSRYHFTSSNYININPIAGLNLRSTFAINRAEQSWNQYQPSGIQESIRYRGGDAYASQQRFGDTQWQWDNTIQYVRDFKQAHHMDVFFGTSASRNIYNVIKANGRRFASDDLGWDQIGSAADWENSRPENDHAVTSLMSYVARGNYNYKYRYFVTVTGRWDGSSKFGSGYQWGFFPSFSLAWDLTNESFFPRTTWVDQIKLRGGFGSVGNQNIGNYLYATMYYPTSSKGEAGFATNGHRGTPNLTWEKQKQTNIGVDLGFFNRRLSVVADVFFTRNKDLLMSHSLATSTGYSSTTENIGDLDNRGVEIQINATPVATRDFTWNIGFNLSHDRNRIKSLYGGVDRLLNVPTESTVPDRSGNLFVGEALHNIYCYKFGGIANEDNRDLWEGIDYRGRTVGLGDIFPLDISGPDGKPDGVIDNYDRTITAYTDPKVYGGFNTDLTWKGLTLNAIFTYSIGGHRLSGYYEGLVSSVGLSHATPDLIGDCWTPDNTDAYFPRRVTNATGYTPFSAGDTDRYIQNTSFLRLSTLTLSYIIPAKITNKIRMNNLRVYFTASNVFTVTKDKGFDPEFGDSLYPTERSYTLGLSFNLF